MTEESYLRMEDVFFMIYESDGNEESYLRMEDAFMKYEAVVND